MEASVFIKTKHVMFEFIEYCVIENLFNTFQVTFKGTVNSTIAGKLLINVYQVTYNSDENVLDEFLGVHTMFTNMISETCPELESLPF